MGLNRLRSTYRSLRASIAVLALIIAASGFAATPLLVAGANAASMQAYIAGRRARMHRLLALDGRLVKWGAPTLGTGAVITYALADSNARYPGSRNCGAMRPLSVVASTTRLPPHVMADELHAAFRAWEAVADLTFRRVDDANAADIVIGTQAFPRGRAFANVTPQPLSGVPQTGPSRRRIEKGLDLPRNRARPTLARPTGLSAIDKALICLNPEQRWKVGFNGDLDVYDLRYTFIHEIGHAIGLDHAGAPGQLMDFKYTETFRSLRAGDIDGAVRLYGPRR